MEGNSLVLVGFGDFTRLNHPLSILIHDHRPILANREKLMLGYVKFLSHLLKSTFMVGSEIRCPPMEGLVLVRVERHGCGVLRVI
jgi:hypothetical protein